MEARCKALIIGTWMVAGLLANQVAASPVGRTENFVVIEAPSAEMAQEVCQAAERYRRELAMFWLGRELPRWQAPCTIRVVAGNRPAEGATHYNRYPGAVGDFQMEVIGTQQRILDSVLPHEVTHTVLATYFGRPLPRWADEGIATTVEHDSEKSKHDGKLHEFLTTGRGIPMNQMFMMKEYPPEMLTLYAQGYSVCQFLIEQKGPREFVQFLDSYFQRRSWTDAVRHHYAYDSLAELQQYWLDWVRVGGGPVDKFAKVQNRHDISQQPPSIALANFPTSPSGSVTDGLQSPAPKDGWYQRRRLTSAEDVRREPSLAGNARAGAGNAQAGTVRSPVGSASPYTVAQPSEPQPVGSQVAPGPASTWSPTRNATLRR